MKSILARIINASSRKVLAGTADAVPMVKVPLRLLQAVREVLRKEVEGMQDIPDDIKQALDRTWKGWE